MRPKDSVLIEAGNYLAYFAKNAEELAQAFRLRHLVFHTELGASIEGSIDKDSYDEGFDHLIVVSKLTNEVVGTYRMQTADMAKSNKGFYTENEFDLSNFPKDIIESSVEVGRACIHEDHRNRRVLFLLWQGLAAYMKSHNYRYFFGCSSVSVDKLEEAQKINKLLKENNYFHQDIKAPVKEPYTFQAKQLKKTCSGKVELPVLLKIYLKYNAKVCSLPAYDKDFKSLDYLTLLDVQDMTDKHYTLFFNENKN